MKERERKTKKLLVGFLVLCCALNVARAANNCTGATYYDSNTDTCIACPNGYDYNTDPGKTDITQCQTHCNGGTYVATVGNGIPGDYTEVEYLESTGTQYIDTGYIPMENTRTEVDLSYTSDSYGNNATMFGVSRYSINFGGSSASSNVYPWLCLYRSDSDCNPTYIVISAELKNMRQTVVLDAKNKKASYGNLSSQTLPQTQMQALGTIYLFGIHNMPANTASIYSRDGMRVYVAKIYEDDVLVRDFVPVRRNNDGAIGMYDMVSGQFFTNAGTGTFIAGNNVSQCTDVGAGYYAGASTVNFGSVGTRTECPAGTYSSITNAEVCTPCAGATYNDETAQAACKSCPGGYDYNTDPGKTDITQCQIHCDAGTWNGEYTQLEYIEATGTQYIDTGVMRTNLTGVSIDFQYTTDASNEQMLFGTVNPNFAFWRRDAFYYAYKNSTGSSGSISVSSDVKIARNTVQLNWKNNGVFRFNDITRSLSSVTFSNSKRLFLYAANYNGAYSKTTGRIYNTKISDGPDIVRDFVPMRRNSDGVIGMYDKVSGQFFTNAGTGTFIAGGDIAGLKCTDVGAGYYAGASTVNYGSFGTRTACPAGTYSNNPNATSINDCAPCSGATYNDETAQAACKSCPPGYDYNTDPGKTDITQCQIHCNAGTYVEIPGIAGYTQLEYIESTGTQWIDTGITATNKTAISTKFISNTPNSVSTTKIVVGDAWGSNAYLLSITGNTTSYTRIGTLYISYSNYWQQGVEYTVSMSDQGTVINGINGTWSGTANTYQTTNHLQIFGVDSAPTRNSMIAMYYLKIYEDGVLVRDFIPARRDSDGVLGMYDMVSGQFFANAGTGEFIAGNDVGAIGGQCTDVGAGYYVGESTVNYGSVGTRNACVAPTTTVGYGHGADEANDCGRVLHIDDKVIYARRNKITTPSLNIRMENGDMFYISLSPTNHSVSRLHMQQGETKYTAYDDSLLYGERDFDTGEQISQ